MIWFGRIDLEFEDLCVIVGEVVDEFVVEVVC